MFVVLNASSGRGYGETLTAHVSSLFLSVGIPAEVSLARGTHEMAAKIADAVSRSAAVIVAGGGDGTVSAVAAALAGTEIALGILPLGTLNHFAKALGLPMALAAAVERIAGGQRLRVDVGEVNGRVFVNNSSLGLYPDYVDERNRQRHAFSTGRFVAGLVAALAVLRRYTYLGVRLSVEGQEHRRRTPFVFIGNNEYQMQGFAMGDRESLNKGCLSLYTARQSGRLRLLILVLRALSGTLKQARNFESLLATEIIIESNAPRLRVATDGEISLMMPPLRYCIRPAALTVIGATRISSAIPQNPEGSTLEPEHCRHPCTPALAA